MRINTAIDISATPQEIWSYVSDINTHTEWIADAADLRFVSHQRSGVGTIYDVDTRLGRVHTTHRMTITQWTEPTLIGVSHKGLVTGTGQFTLEPMVDRTIFRWEEDLELPWWMGGRVGEFVAGPVLRAIWARSLKGLKRRIERGAGLRTDDEGLTPGALIGQGRDGDVREYGRDRVIRTSRSGADLGPEQELMVYLADQGYPVPRLYPHPDPDVTVMERIHGPTMLQDLISKPWRMKAHARTLASLHEQLRSIEPPAGLRRLGHGESIVHLDLHPENVLMTDEGPFVIDWANAAVGSGDLDKALTWVIIKTGEVTGSVAAKLLTSGFREQFVRLYAKAAGEESILANATAAAELRLLDRNLLTGERDAVFRLARGLQDRPTHSRTDDA